MLKNRFEKLKCSFGTGASDFPEFTLKVESLAPGSDFPQVGIIDGEMVFKRCVCQLEDERSNLVNTGQRGHESGFRLADGFDIKAYRHTAAENGESSSK
jgi:hypothetical protein